MFITLNDPIKVEYIKLFNFVEIANRNNFMSLKPEGYLEMLNRHFKGVDRETIYSLYLITKILLDGNSLFVNVGAKVGQTNECFISPFINSAFNNRISIREYGTRAAKTFFYEFRAMTFLLESLSVSNEDFLFETALEFSGNHILKHTSRGKDIY